MPRIVHTLPPRRVVEAYRALAAGKGAPDDWALFAADLEAFGGFWEVTTADTPHDQRAFAEGQRSVLGRIQALTRVSEAALDQIDAAQEQQEI